MIRLVVLVILALAAVALALILQRRRPDPPAAPSYRAPTQLDRDDFDQPGTPYLVAVFASSTCNTCPEVWAMVERHGAADLVPQRIDVQDRADLHGRYRIDGVPTTVLADAQGVVANTFFGPISEDALADALASLRAGPEGMSIS